MNRICSLLSISTIKIDLSLFYVIVPSLSCSLEFSYAYMLSCCHLSCEIIDKVFTWPVCFNIMNSSYFINPAMDKKFIITYKIKPQKRRALKVVC